MGWVGVLVGKGAFLSSHSWVEISLICQLTPTAPKFSFLEKGTCILGLPHIPTGSKIIWENSSAQTWKEGCWLWGFGCGNKWISFLHCWIIV